MHRVRVVAILLALAWALSVRASVIECWPVPDEDAQLYDDWAARLDPPLQWESCANQCQHGLRLCRFIERPPSASDQAYMGTCNGRAKGPPCQLAPISDATTGPTN